MRWMRFYREDLDSPAFQAGIERFGTGFVHDVLRVWQTLCVEDGTGIRELPVSDDTLLWLTRRMRVEGQDDVRARLGFMAEWRLIEMKSWRGGRRLRPLRDGSNVYFVIGSRELQRRRDEWSKRKLRELKGKGGTNTPEPHRSDSGVTPVQETEIEIETETEEEVRGQSRSGVTLRSVSEDIGKSNEVEIEICTAWKSRWHTKMKFFNGNRSALDGLLRNWDSATVLAAWRKYLAEDTPYLREKRHPFGTFCRQVDHYVQDGGPDGQEAADPLGEDIPPPPKQVSWK